MIFNKDGVNSKAAMSLLPNPLKARGGVSREEDDDDEEDDFFELGVLLLLLL